ncbi:MAG: GGDEF domain-containing protein [Cyanobacteria bacterium SID2]|nr:GGDEF domain-containing protein [Cyanobacteria bacterium SID2]
MVNTITFFSVLIADQLRNSGFIMMVIQRLQGDLKAQANIDFLTKTFNRRAIQEQLSNEELKYYKMGKTFSVVLLDIDRFKSINDNYGHDGGDIVLKHLSEVLKQNLRKRDILGRWGGEEFIVILPDTPIDRALIVAERLRKSVESNPAANGLIQHTISLGVATFMQHGQTMKKLIKNVDTALYQAKKTGRNKVIKAIEIEVNPNPDRNHRA